MQDWMLFGSWIASVGSGAPLRPSQPINKPNCSLSGVFSLVGAESGSLIFTSDLMAKDSRTHPHTSSENSLAFTNRGKAARLDSPNSPTWQLDSLVKTSSSPSLLGANLSVDESLRRSETLRKPGQLFGLLIKGMSKVRFIHLNCSE
jgi:hypothetical protein